MPDALDRVGVGPASQDLSDEPHVTACALDAPAAARGPFEETDLGRPRKPKHSLNRLSLHGTSQSSLLHVKVGADRSTDRAISEPLRITDLSAASNLMQRSTVRRALRVRARGSLSSSSRIATPRKRAMSRPSCSTRCLATARSSSTASSDGRGSLMLVDTARDAPSNGVAMGHALGGRLLQHLRC